MSSVFVACGGGSSDDGADDGAGGEDSSAADGGGSSSDGSSSGGSSSGTGGGETETVFDLGMDGAEGFFLEGFPKTILSHDRKILIAGVLDADFWVARFDEDGEPDTTFGDEGKTVVAFPSEENAIFNANVDVAYALHASDDALWVAGAVRGIGAGVDSRWGLARMSLDGALDSSFQDDGIRLIDWTIGSRAYGVHEDAEGRVYINGTIDNPQSTDMAVVRFLPTGESDTTFRLKDTGAGAVLTNGRNEEGIAGVLLEDRFIVAGGSDFVTAAVDLDGKNLTDFGDSGWATPTEGTVYAMVRSGDSLFLAGPEPSRDSRTEAITIVKMDFDGVLDESFGVGGVARLTYDFGNYVWPELETQLGLEDSFVRVNGLAVLEDGSLLVYADALGFLTRYPVLLKAKADGTLDTSFGQEGLAAFPVGMPLLASTLPQSATRLAARGGVAWFVDEGVFSKGNRGFLIRVELDRL